MAEHSETSTSAQRWRIHRGGVVNIWEFAQQDFDYSGGRVVIQGTNGSGKSRTLELQLPLTLDGDLSNMGSKGHGSVSIRRLMLDDYTAGINRVGYTWTEYRRVTEQAGSADGLSAYGGHQLGEVVDHEAGPEPGQLLGTGAPVHADHEAEAAGDTCEDAGGRVLDDGALGGRETEQLGRLLAGDLFESGVDPDRPHLCIGQDHRGGRLTDCVCVATQIICHGQEGGVIGFPALLVSSAHAPADPQKAEEYRRDQQHPDQEEAC